MTQATRRGAHLHGSDKRQRLVALSLFMRAANWHLKTFRLISERQMRFDWFECRV